MYDHVRGTGSGRRYIIRCKKCKISEQYGYYFKDEKRCLDLDQLICSKYFLSTEDTCFTKEMFRIYSYELILNCMPFQSKANIYNHVFGYVDTTNKRKT